MSSTPPRYSPRMRSRAGVALLVALVAAGCGGGGGPRIDRGDARSSDVLELRTTVGGAFAHSLGTSREWYSPRDGIFRVEHRVEGEPFLMTYDGSAITRQVRAGIVRVTASDPRAMREFLDRVSFFQAPGIYVTKLYLRQVPPNEAVHVRAVDGGRALLARLHYQDEGLDVRVPIRVDIVSRRPFDRRVFRPFRGKLVGAVRQAPPGARSQFGEHALWFGPRLGAARAVTTIESFGRDPWSVQDEARGGQYETVYVLPRSTFPPAERPQPDTTYPGLGSHSALQLWVSCMAGRRGPPFGVGAGTPPERLLLATGERATLYVEVYSERARDGVFATILVGDTTCFITGVIPPREFRRLAASLERPR
jgi:hypothetical protein